MKESATITSRSTPIDSDRLLLKRVDRLLSTPLLFDVHELVATVFTVNGAIKHRLRNNYFCQCLFHKSLRPIKLLAVELECKTGQKGLDLASGESDEIASSCV